MLPDWLNVVNAWAAIPLQIVGFGFAFWQIGKARSSAEAAKSAAERTQSQIGTNLLLVVLPQLTQIEANLEWAVRRSDKDAVVQYLSAWRWQAGQVRGHIETYRSDSEEFMVALQSSIAMAGDTKLALQDPAADITKRTRSALRAIATVTGLVGEMTAIESTSAKGVTDA